MIDLEKTAKLNEIATEIYKETAIIDNIIDEAQGSSFEILQKWLKHAQKRQKLELEYNELKKTL